MSSAAIDVVFAIPGDLSRRTGGYGYDRRILQEAAAHGIAMRHLALPAAFPHPSAADLAATARLSAETPAAAVLLVDGLAYGALPADLIRGIGRCVVALVHHPLGLESGLDAAAQERLVASERAALALADHVVVTSHATARTLAAGFGVPPEAMTVAEPGTDPAPRAKGSPAGTPLRLLAVGSTVPRKAYDVLVAALAGLADPPWRLEIVGGAEAATAQALRRQIAAARLERRIRIVGELDGAALAAAYDQADVFVSASLYEGYGMALCEAMARGLPIVAASGGAAADTVSDAAGLKVPPGDTAALGEALRRMLDDRALRAAAAEASWRAGQQLPTWNETTARIAAALRSAMARQAPPSKRSGQ